MVPADDGCAYRIICMVFATLNQVYFTAQALRRNPCRWSNPKWGEPDRCTVLPFGVEVQLLKVVHVPFQLPSGAVDPTTLLRADSAHIQDDGRAVA